MPDSDLRVHEDVRVDTSHGDHERFAHYVDKNEMMESAIFGTPIKALCGKIWVPSRTRRSSLFAGVQGNLRVAAVRRRRRRGVSVADESPRTAADNSFSFLRGWQKAAYEEYFRVTRRDSCWSRRPARARRGTPSRWPRSCSRPARSRSSPWSRPPSTSSTSGLRRRRASDRHRPSYRNAQGRAGADFRGVAVTYAQVAAHRAARAAHGEPADAGHLRRDPPRRRRAVLGRRGQGGVRAGPAAARADRDAVQVGREPDSFRDLCAGGRRVQAVGVRLRVRVRSRAGRRRGAAGDLPRLLRRDALADAGGRRDHGHAGHADDEGPDRAGVADRARPVGGVDQPGARGRRQAAHRGAPRDAGRGRPCDRGDHETARAYAGLLRRVSGERPVVVLSDDPTASRKITSFAASQARWMVAVRMVSEGVDVPRLAVGVYATSVSTASVLRAGGGPVRPRAAAGRDRFGVRAFRSCAARVRRRARGRATTMWRARCRRIRRPSLPRPRGSETRRTGRSRAAPSRRCGVGDVRPRAVRRWRVRHGDRGGSPEEEDFLGLPGLLEPDQVATLLRKRQAASWPPARRPFPPLPLTSNSSSFSHFCLKRRRLPLRPLRWRTGFDSESRRTCRSPQGAQRPGGRLEPPDRSAARGHPRRIAPCLRGPAIPQASAEEIRARIAMIRQWALSRR